MNALKNNNMPLKTIAEKKQGLQEQSILYGPRGYKITLCNTAEGAQPVITISGTKSYRKQLEQYFGNTEIIKQCSEYSDGSDYIYYIELVDPSLAINSLKVIHLLESHENALGFTCSFYDPSSPQKIEERTKEIVIDKDYLTHIEEMSAQETKPDTYLNQHLYLPFGCDLSKAGFSIKALITKKNNLGNDIFMALQEDQEPDSYYNLIKNGKSFGYKRIVQNGKNGIMSPSGNIILDYQYDCMPGNVDALGHILVRNGKKWGLLHLNEKTETCKEVVPCIYDEITRFKFKDSMQELYAMGRIGENRYIIHEDYSITPK